MARKSLSVVLATYNEEANLSKCLASVENLADEIVVIDGTSKDKTLEIAKEFGAIVQVTTNKPNFHINKQMAIDMASKDWILQIDADEVVSPELADEIRQVLGSSSSLSENLRPKTQDPASKTQDPASKTQDPASKTQDPSPINGYWIPRKNWFLGRFLMKGGQYPDYTLRLYLKGKGKLPQRDVHEQAVVEGKVGYLKNPLLHYPYKNFRHYLQKWILYNNFFANQIKEDLQKKNFLQKVFYAVIYLFIKPAHWLLTTFIRHKGFVDGWQGFVFSLFSALRFPVSYIIYLTL